MSGPAASTLILATVTGAARGRRGGATIVFVVVVLGMAGLVIGLVANAVRRDRSGTAQLEPHPGDADAPESGST
ncbi:hypothetical protein [Euzebya rosea]|uniref:hypothetical protein n=1 Tax=Euzebya rosea TaxID=2052804 RepID=UPI000D3E8AB6|nr:hypothetical protein [Euzebya rosea]